MCGDGSNVWGLGVMGGDGVIVVVVIGGDGKWWVLMGVKGYEKMIVGDEVMGKDDELWVVMG